MGGGKQGSVSDSSEDEISKRAAAVAVDGAVVTASASKSAEKSAARMRRRHTGPDHRGPLREAGDEAGDGSNGRDENLLQLQPFQRQALAALHAYLDGIIDTTKKRRKKWPKSSADSSDCVRVFRRVKDWSTIRDFAAEREAEAAAAAAARAEAAAVAAKEARAIRLGSSRKKKKKERVDGEESSSDSSSEDEVLRQAQSMAVDATAVQAFAAKASQKAGGVFAAEAAATKKPQKGQQEAAESSSDDDS